MRFQIHNRWCLMVLLIVLWHFSLVSAVCYLEDANADCAACWKTTETGTGGSKVVVTTLSACPVGITFGWDSQLPENMAATTSYLVNYSIHVDRDLFPVHVTDEGEISHANIHSCFASAGVCTPFVADTPGLATHTPAVTSPLDENGNAHFSTKLQLSPESYTIIAHTRFFVHQSDPSLPLVTYDVAVGLFRRVSACDTGFVFDEAKQDCQPCPAGTEPRGGVCDPCMPGTYSPHQGMSTCLPCLDGYADGYGMTFCKACPHNHEIKRSNGAGMHKNDCVCKEGYTFGCQWRPQIWQLAIVAVVSLLIGCCALTMRVCRRALAVESEEALRVAGRMAHLRDCLRLRPEDGVVLVGESVPWSSRLTWSKVKGTLHGRHLEGLARLTLMMPFEIEAVDSLLLELRLLEDAEGHFRHAQAMCELLIEVSRQLLAHCTAAQRRGSASGDGEEGGERRGSVLSVVFERLSPARRMSDGSELRIPPADAATRFQFFRDRVIRLQLWSVGENFSGLKREVQIFMDDLRQSMDDLYLQIKDDRGGQALVDFEWPGPDSNLKPPQRQDHARVQAVRVDAAAAREMELQVHNSAVTCAVLCQGGSSAASDCNSDCVPCSPTPSNPPLPVHLASLGPQIAMSMSSSADAMASVAPGLGVQPAVPSEAWLAPAALSTDDGEPSSSGAPKRARAEAEERGRGLQDLRSRGRDAPPASSPQTEGEDTETSSQWLGARRSTLGSAAAAEGAEGSGLLSSLVARAPLQRHRPGSMHAPSLQPFFAEGPSAVNEDVFVHQLWLRAKLLNPGFQRQVRHVLEVRAAEAIGPRTLASDATSHSKTSQHDSSPGATHGGPLAPSQSVPEGPGSTADPERLMTVKGGDSSLSTLKRGSMSPVGKARTRRAGSLESGQLQLVSGEVKAKAKMQDKVVRYAKELAEAGERPEEHLPLAANILDPLRASIICPGPESMLDLARWLIANGERCGLPVVRVKNKFALADSRAYDGYRDLMLCVLYTGEGGLSVIGELQLHDGRMYPLKVRMHRLYKVKRAPDAGSVM